MSDSYNSILISNLYNSKNDKEIEEIINEMEEIGNPIFLRPIYDIYKRNLNSTNSYFYINSILEYKNSENFLDIVLEILHRYSDLEYKEDISEFFNFLSDTLYVDDIVLNIGKDLISRFSDNNIAGYDIDIVIKYFHKINKLKDIESYLYKVSINTDIEIQQRILAFNYWLKIDLSKKLDFILELNFNSSSNKLDLVIANTIINWKGPRILQIKEKILLHGSKSAKERILRYEENKKKNESLKNIKDRENKNEDSTIENILLINDIINLRIQINKFSLSLFEQSIFLPSDEFIFISFSPNSTNYKELFLNLRDIFGKINNAFKDLHGLEDKRIKEILNGGFETRNKPINALFLYLKSKNIEIDDTMYGFRSIYSLVSVMGSHSNTETEKILKILKENDLETFYLKNDFEQIHKNILLKYKQFLEKLYSNLHKLN